MSANLIYIALAQPKTNCNLKTLRVEESFWTKKQSCNLSKVDIKNWRPFFEFVCFNGCHLLKLDLQKRTSVLDNPPNGKLFVYQKCIIYPKIENVFLILNSKLP